MDLTITIRIPDRKSGRIVSARKILGAIRRCLRQELWCQFETTRVGHHLLIVPKGTTEEWEERASYGSGA